MKKILFIVALMFVGVPFALAAPEEIPMPEPVGPVMAVLSNGCGCSCTFRIFDPRRSKMDGTPDANGNYVTSKVSLWCNKTVEFQLWGRWNIGGITDLTEPQIVKNDGFFPLRIDTATGLGVTQYFTLHTVARYGYEEYRSRWNLTVQPVVCGPPLSPSINALGSNEVTIYRAGP